jgi:P4 family phage/plasmid primase-like protien
MSLSKKDYLNKLSDNYKNSLHIAEFKKQLNFKEYSSYLEFWENYKKYNETERHFFEIISLGKEHPLALKPYLEIEYYDNDVKSIDFIKSMRKYLNKFILEKIIGVGDFREAKTKQSFAPLKPKILIMDSSGLCIVKNKYKNSFHFVISNIGYFNNIYDCKIFINLFIEYLRDINDSIICQRDIGNKRDIPIDMSVYGSWQLMRLPYSSKGLMNTTKIKSDNRILYPIISNKKVSIDKITDKLLNYLFISNIENEDNKLSDYIKNIQINKGKTAELCSVSAKNEISDPDDKTKTYVCKSLLKKDINKTEKIENNETSIIVKLLDCYSYDRCYEYYSWLLVGNALYNHFNGSNTGYNLWINWSKKCKEKFDLDVCELKWNQFKSSSLLYKTGSLYYWAKCDNEKKYKEIIINSYFNKAYNAINNDYKTAELIHEIFNNTIVCTIDEKNHTSWYIFDGIKFKPDFGCIFLKKRISVDLVEIYEKILNFLKNKKINLLNDDNDDDNDDDNNNDNENKKNELKKINNKIKLIEKTIEKLSSNGYKKSLVDECKQFFIDSKLESKLNSNPNLLAFENGIYDLTLGILREGCPEDYISFTTGIELDLDINCDELKNQFLNKIIPNHEVLDYLLRFLASCLKGGCQDQLFHFFTGEGSNGKSRLINLLEKTFGDYYTSLKTVALMGKDKDADNATPSFSKLPGKRCVGLSEANKGSNLNLALFKKITGCDSFQARKLYKDEFEFKIQAKFIMLCNDLPEINSIDYSTWRRIRKVNFPSKFVDNPKNKNEFKKNDKLFTENNMYNLAKQLITVLIKDYYPKYLNIGLKPPNDVIKHTDLYLNQSNTYYIYCNDYIEKTDNDNDFIDFKILYSKYKIWYRYNSYPIKQLDSMKKAKNNFINYYFKENPIEDMINGKKTFVWKKYKFLEEYDDILDN